jgi:hypothetical protein
MRFGDEKMATELVPLIGGQDNGYGLGSEVVKEDSEVWTYIQRDGHCTCLYSFGISL